MPDPTERATHERAYEIATVDRLIAVINQGDDGADITRDYNTLVSQLGSAVERFGGTHKGELTIKIGFTADHKGVDIAIAASTKLPKRPVTKERYFMTERGDSLTAKDPGRGSMFEGVDMGRRSTSLKGA